MSILEIMAFSEAEGTMSADRRACARERPAMPAPMMATLSTGGGADAVRGAVGSAVDPAGAAAAAAACVSVVRGNRVEVVVIASFLAVLWMLLLMPLPTDVNAHEGSARSAVSSSRVVGSRPMVIKGF
mmetsp:Transcript_30677/g.64830  ORF Transcript_30677/g.64830 Transcript_30677/m.64830 type:complete len:128 (-) Transcript_30677:9-392(-)